jgi:hypothetical protein
MPPWHYPESIKARVIALRDEYERIFVRLIDHLPLRSDIDKHLGWFTAVSLTLNAFDVPSNAVGLKQAIHGYEARQ